MKTLFYLNGILLLVALFIAVVIIGGLIGCDTQVAQSDKPKHPALIEYNKVVRQAQQDYATRRNEIIDTYAIIQFEYRRDGRTGSDAYKKLIKEKQDLIDKSIQERDKRIQDAWQKMRDTRLNLTPATQ